MEMDSRYGADSVTKLSEYSASIDGGVKILVVLRLILFLEALLARHCLFSTQSAILTIIQYADYFISFLLTIIILKSQQMTFPHSIMPPFIFLKQQIRISKSLKDGKTIKNKKAGKIMAKCKTQNLRSLSLGRKKNFEEHFLAFLILGSLDVYILETKILPPTSH